MAYKVHFETTDKQIVELPLLQIGTRRMVEMEDGRLADFDEPSSYAKYRLKRWVKTIEVPDPLPEPFDPQRAEAIKELREALNRFPSGEYQRFVNENPRLETALRKGFHGMTPEKVRELTSLIETERERVKQERTRAIPPPTLSQFQLTKSFYHSRAEYGDLKIDGPEPKQYGTAANNFEDCEWWCYCGRCEKPGQQTRYVSARVLLEMECAYRGKFDCQRPCKN
jgi:hypothetical protein